MKEDMAELRRRAELIGNPLVTPTSPDQPPDDQFSPFLFGAIRVGLPSPGSLVERPTEFSPSVCGRDDYLSSSPSYANAENALFT